MTKAREWEKIKIIEHKVYAELKQQADRLAEALKEHGHENRYNPNCDMCRAIQNYQEFKKVKGKE
jgi:hypothetical protein